MQVNLSKADVEAICSSYFLKLNCTSDPSSSLSYKSIKIESYELNNLSDDINGFLANHLILTVNYKLATNQSHCLTFFAKTLPINQSEQLKYIEGFRAFEKEVDVYRSIIPRLQSLSTSKWSPQCYLARFKDLLVFEDLRIERFQLYKNGNGLFDWPHLLVAINSVAKVHACSLAFEWKSGQSIINLYSFCLYENAYPSNGMKIRRSGFENAVRVGCSLIKVLPNYRKKIDDILPKFQSTMDRIFKFCQTSKYFRNVFSHGDLWANNIMFKYNNNTPINAFLVDYQLARYAPPAYDLLTLVCLTTTRNFRSLHWDKIISSYWSTLENELSLITNFKLKLSIEISRQEFEESCKYFKLAGLIESFLFGHLTVLPDSVKEQLVANPDNFGEFINADRTKFCGEAFENDELYRERMTDILTEIIDEYILIDQI